MFINDPNESEVSKIMEDNKEIKEAMNELEKISKDKELRRVAELREKAIRDEKNGLRHAKEEGIKEGIKEGIEQVAKKMLELNIPIQDIIKTNFRIKEKRIIIKKSAIADFLMTAKRLDYYLNKFKILK